MTMPEQKPGRSKQDYGTPQKFIAAVKRKFGPLVVDLAASKENYKAALYVTEEENSLTKDWTEFGGVNMWLNPPFDNIEVWATKCWMTTQQRTFHPSARIFLLTPASIGTRWFADVVQPHAFVLGLSPRLTFEGCDDPYPKDLMLSIFGGFRGFDTWRWK